MHTPRIALFGALTTTLALSAGLAIAAPPAVPDGPTATQYIVSFDSGAAPAGAAAQQATVDAIAARQDAPVEQVREMLDGSLVVRFEQSVDAAQLAAQAEALPGVRAIQVDELLSSQAPDQAVAAPTLEGPDPSLSRQWYLTDEVAGINALPAMKISQGQDITVGVIDTGYTNHPDLAHVEGFDFLRSQHQSRDGDARDTDPRDEGDWADETSTCVFFPGLHPSTWQGTKVAGVLSARNNNAVGIAGVAGAVNVSHGRVASFCLAYTSDVIDAMLWTSGVEPQLIDEEPLNPDNPLTEYFTPNPAQVLNVTHGTRRPPSDPTCPVAMRSAIDQITAAGVSIVASAGDWNTTDFIAPAGCDGVIAVGALDRDGTRWSDPVSEANPYPDGSGHGRWLDLMAPGADTDGNGIYTTSNLSATIPRSSSYSYAHGTAMATPQVSGTVALMRSLNAELTPEDVAEVLADTARPMPRPPFGTPTCTDCGEGILDTTRAVSAIGGFIDMPYGTTFQRDVTWLAWRGITKGWDLPDGSRQYAPLATINRDAMAAFLYRLAGSPAFTPPRVSPFTDIKPGDPFYKEVSWLADQRITTGYADGSFRPTAPVNRDAMAAFLYRSAGSPTYVAPTNSPFSDIVPSSGFYREMCWLHENAISTGWEIAPGVREYRPMQPVARDAMAAFLHRIDNQDLFALS